jgi:hypothetical protein
MFMLFTMFGNLVQQIMPHFVSQRSLYEVRILTAPLPSVRQY